MILSFGSTYFTEHLDTPTPYMYDVCNIKSLNVKSIWFIIIVMMSLLIQSKNILYFTFGKIRKSCFLEAVLF